MPRKKKTESKEKVKKVPKKRGRKPKGGKIVQKNIIVKQENVAPENIILHLKCSKKDIKKSDDKYLKNSEVSEIKSFNINKNKNNAINFDEYKKKKLKKNNYNLEIQKENINENKNKNTTINQHLIWDKLKLLRQQLYNNDISDKRSDCFWCTCQFDNPPIFIPKCYVGNQIEVYGCFCSPECAVAYLKKEKIDTSTLWERYSMLNNIYSKIYKYDKNIKPAPNPFYTLEKYYGNLTIEEYRNQLKNDSLLMVVEKPLTKVMPDMYEENNELPDIYSSILDNNYNNNKSYSLYRNKKTSSKSTILNNNFSKSNI
jgi:hypothetical protein